MSYARKLENVTITSKSSFIESKSMARALALFDSIHTPFYLVHETHKIRTIPVFAHFFYAFLRGTHRHLKPLRTLVYNHVVTARRLT